jgi:hypothetical protein
MIMRDGVQLSIDEGAMIYRATANRSVIDAWKDGDARKKSFY